MRKYFYLLIVISSIFFSCKKSDNTTTEQKTIEQKFKEDAAYNNNIISGVGNCFFEENLMAGSESQLTFKLAYNEDTLAGYGKIDNSGKVQYINSTVLARKGNSELIVTEIFPDVSKSRRYTMTNGIKSNLVIEINYYTGLKYTVSILDMNWSTGNSITLKSNYFSDGKLTSDYSSFRVIEGEKKYPCPDPPVTGDHAKDLQADIVYINCITLAAFKPSIDAIEKMLEDIKNKPGQIIDNINNSEKLKTLLSYYTSLSNNLQNSLSKLKFSSKNFLDGLLKDLEKNINKLQNQPLEVQLVPFAAGTDADYDEVTDNEIKLSFTVVEKSSGLPYTKGPVFIDMAFYKPGTTDIVFVDTRSSVVNNGLVIFKFDPKTIPNYEGYSSLTARYSFSKDNLNPYAERNISLKFIKPKVVFADGSSLPSPIPFTNNAALPFKLVNEDGRNIIINYSLVTIANNANNKISISKTTYANDFSIRLSTLESTSQNTTFDVFYNSKKVQTINASLDDSTEYYKNLVLGTWTNTWTSDFRNTGVREFYEEDEIQIRTGGVAYWTQARYYTGNISITGTDVGWKIYHSGNIYIMQIGAQSGRITPAQSFTNIGSTYTIVSAKK